MEHPEFFPWTRSKQLKFTVRRTVQRATCVLTPSEFSKRGIIAAYDLEDEKVVVVPNAVSSEFRPRSRESAARKIEQRYGIKSPFLLTVGDLQPRKNQAGLVEAFTELIRFYPNLPHNLVMIGKDGWYGSRVRRAAQKSGLAKRIHFPGFVSDEELTAFYAACEVFVFPSFYEGFGLPILEAMASGRAVACSNTTAMPEVADSCALLFDPESIEAMTLAMRDLVVDNELRRRVERLGMQRASLYSWRNTAQKTLEAYYAVAGSRRSEKSFRVKSVPVT